MSNSPVFKSRFSPLRHALLLSFIVLLVFFVARYKRPRNRAFQSSRLNTLISKPISKRPTPPTDDNSNERVLPGGPHNHTLHGHTSPRLRTVIPKPISKPLTTPTNDNVNDTSINNVLPTIDSTATPTSTSQFLRNPCTSNNTSKVPSEEAWDLPEPLNSHLHLSRTSHKHLSTFSWQRPKVLFAYARPLEDDFSSTEVFVYATGLRMGTKKRNITVVGCLVSDEVHLAVDERGEVYVCAVPRQVKVGEAVGLVLRRDEELRAAMEGATGVESEERIEEGEISALRSDALLVLGDTFPGVTTSDLVTIPSDVRITHVSQGVGELQEKARYEVCMGTQMKTFRHLLGDWVEYHRRLGVDMVYVLDNDAEPDLSGFSADAVEVVYWPWEKSQTQALSYLLVALRERCEWVLLSDADEYVLVGLHEDSQEPGGLREYLRRRPGDEAQHFLPYLTMGPSAQVSTPREPAPEAYTYKWARQKENGKVVARADAEWVSSRVHMHRLREGGEAGVVTRAARDARPVFGAQAVMVHFQHRSFEEMLMKRVAGSGSIDDRQQGRGKKAVGGPRSVPKQYREVDEEMRYTFFRDVWREVSKLDERQVLVRTVEGRRWTQQVGC